MTVQFEARQALPGGRSRAGVKAGSPGSARIPASFAQEALWFLSRYDADSPLYNCPLTIRLEGSLNVGALQAALEALRARHEVLRTCFFDGPDGLWQIVKPPSPLDLRMTDLQQRSPAEQQAEAAARTQAAARTAFNLDEGPLVTAELVRLQEDEHLLLLTLHHTIYDGWSRGVLMRDLVESYEAAASGRPPDLLPLPLQYADYALRQREELQGEKIERLLSFWREELDGVGVLDLPTDFPRPARQTFAGQTTEHTLPGELCAAVKAFSRSQGVTLFVTLASALQALLHRYTDQDDLTIGFPVAGRNRVEFEELIGPFINTLVLGADFSGDPTVSDLLGRQRQRALLALAHQDMPFDKLVKELSVPRELGRSPLFGVMLHLRNLPSGICEQGGLRWTPSRTSVGMAQFDLSLAMADVSGELRIEAEYNTDLFAEPTMRRLLQHYEVLLEDMTRGPHKRVSELALLTEAERRQLLVTWNQTERDLPAGVCVHDLFTAQARRTPQSPAAAYRTQTLTYGQLDSITDRLAAHLVHLGAEPGRPIGMYVAPGLDIPIAFMAVLKAGGACLPLDPSLPLERIKFMIADSEAPLVVASPALAEALQVGTEARVAPLEPSQWDEAPPDGAPLPRVGPEDICYITYTSGSTGEPKGVALRHRGMVSLLCRDYEVHPAEALAGTLLATSIGFDAGVGSVFLALTSGGCLILIDNILDPQLTTPVPVTLLDAVPSVVSELIAHGTLPPTVHTVVLSGEPAPGSLVRRLYEAHGVQRVFNEYGPTETTLTSTAALIPRDSGDHPSIGRPVANTRVYVLDKYGHPVPVGVRGELHIAGMGVAAGYINRPELTGERFVDDPFSGAAGGKMYRTGDVVRYDDKGNLHFLGRVDSQVKIRGCRVELEEVQNAVQTHPAVQQAAVVAVEEPSGSYALAAYVSLWPGADLTREHLRQYLRGDLPEFMLPTLVTFLDTLPLRTSGKVDLEALPPPLATPSPAIADHESCSPLETRLLGLWAESLGLDQVGLDDSFFDLGGHSLSAARLLARIREVTGGEPPLPLLFRAPTVRQFAGALFAGGTLGQGDCLVPIQPSGDRPALFCAHHETGEAFCYVLLSAYLPDEQPLYGIRAPEDGLEDPNLTLRALACHYVAAMRKQQAEGPYHLLGYSQAAMLAFELAQQLRAEGQEVGLLALVDYPAQFAEYHRPRGWPRLRDSRQLLRDLPSTYAYDRCLTAQERRDEWRNRARRFKAVLGLGTYDPRPDLVPDPARRERLDSLLRAYQPEPYAGDVVILRARQQDLFCSHDPAMGWKQFVQGKVEVIHLPGMHGRLMHDPFVTGLAAHLTERLQTG